MIEVDYGLEEMRPRICVIGVGGGGGNTIANMIASGVKGVTFVAANTDAQALQNSPAERILQLGRRTTEGLGAGSRAEQGKVAAEESAAEIDQLLEGVHMCFVAAGLGGGTGTGAAPVIARIAKAKGILTVGVVTKPFAFEGKRRAEAAERGLEELQRHVDTLIVIPNQNLFRIANPDTTFKDAFDLADQVLQQGVRGITDLMVMPGLINLDFADIRTIMANMGKAMIGTGEAAGDDRGLRAAEQAINNPLLDEALQGARGLIISITGGDDMKLMEIDEVASHVQKQVDPDADIIWGSAFDPALEGRMRVSLLATGIDAERTAETEPQPMTVPVSLQQLTQQATIREPVFGPPPPPLHAAPVEPVEPVIAAGSVEPEAAPESSDEELLLSVERPPVLTAPEWIDQSPAAPAAALIRAAERSNVLELADARERGPSLFERMASLARGAAKEVREAGDQPPMPHLHRGRNLHGPDEEFARAA